MLNVDVLLTVIKASSQHINSGTINVRAPLTVQPAVGYADLSNSGPIAISSGKSLVINPGTFHNSTTGLVNIGVDGRVADVNLAQLRVFGGAFLGGTLNLLLAQNFIPELDDSLVVVTAYSRSGAFQSIRIPTLNGNPLLVAGYGVANVHLKAFNDFANIRELTIGQPYGDSLRSGFYRFYKVFLPAGVTQWFRAGCADPLVAPQLFVARGGLPSRSQFDFSSRVELPQLSEISIPSVDSAAASDRCPSGSP